MHSVMLTSVTSSSGVERGSAHITMGEQAKILAWKIILMPPPPEKVGGGAKFALPPGSQKIP